MAADRCLQVDDKNVKAMYRKGKALMQMKRYTEAKAILRKALIYEPESLVQLPFTILLNNTSTK